MLFPSTFFLFFKNDIFKNFTFINYKNFVIKRKVRFSKSFDPIHETLYIDLYINNGTLYKHLCYIQSYTMNNVLLNVHFNMLNKF